MADLDKVLRTARTWVGDIPGVAAVEAGEEGGQPCIEVWVTGAADRHRIPEEREGIPVVVRETEPGAGSGHTPA